MQIQGPKWFHSSGRLTGTLGVWIIWQQPVVNMPAECGWESCHSLAPPMVLWVEKIVAYMEGGQHPA